jgi:hypothetical protein
MLNSSTGLGVVNRNVTLTLYQTQKYTYSQQYPNLRTNQSGYAWIELYLSPQANNNQTVFNVVASFGGDSVSTATASMTLLNGTSYAVCTTLQYNSFKPSSNSTSITVTPQTTTGATTLINQEQMQKDAESKGWFTIDPEFSWSYPWVRLHLKLNMDLPQGNRAVDYGWSPLPYGTSCTANFAVLNEVLNEFSVDIESHILLSLVFSFAIRTGIYLFMGATGFALGIAIALYWAYAIIDGLIFYLTSSNNPKAWLATFITQLWSLGAGVVEGMFAAGRFLTAVSRWILGQVSHVMNSMWAMRLNFFNISGILFTIFDFLIMVAYLGAYFLTVG